MTPTQLLYQTAGQPFVEGLLDAMQFAALKRQPATHPPSGPCYLCGQEVDGNGLPTSARFNDDTWTGHGTAAAVVSEWLCPACAFSLNEAVDMPAIYPKKFKMRCQTHFVTGEIWRVLGLSDKRQIAEILLNPPSDPWLLAICDSPLSAGHNLYLTSVNRGQSWTIMLGRVAVRSTTPELIYLLGHVEALYAIGHSKTNIGNGNYTPKWIGTNPSAWAMHESAIAEFRNTPIFQLALFLAQKGSKDESDD